MECRVQICAKLSSIIRLASGLRQKQIVVSGLQCHDSVDLHKHSLQEENKKTQRELLFNKVELVGFVH